MKKIVSFLTIITPVFFMHGDNLDTAKKDLEFSQKVVMGYKNKFLPALAGPRTSLEAKSFGAVFNNYAKALNNSRDAIAQSADNDKDLLNPLKGLTEAINVLVNSLKTVINTENISSKAENLVKVRRVPLLLNSAEKQFKAPTFFNPTKRKALNLALATITSLRTLLKPLLVELGPFEEHVADEMIDTVPESTTAEVLKKLGLTSKSRANDVLGVKADATLEEITKAYRRLSVQWHPDRNMEIKTLATQITQLLNWAKDTLIKKHERNNKKG